MTEDFYDLLDIPPDATQDEIKEAYREKVRVYHPDVNDDDRAQAQFTAVKKAHEILGDPVERQAYDRLGHKDYVAKRTSGIPSPDVWGNSSDSDASGDSSSGSSGATATASQSAAGTSTSGGTGRTGGTGGTDGTAGSKSTSRSQSRSKTTSRNRSGTGATGTTSDSRSTGTGSSSTNTSASAETGTAGNTAETAGTATGTGTGTGTGSTQSASGTATSDGGTTGHAAGSTAAGSTARGRTSSTGHGSRWRRLTDNPLVHWWKRQNFSLPLIWLSVLIYAGGLVHFGLENRRALEGLVAELTAVGADPAGLWTVLTTGRHGVEMPSTFVVRILPVTPPIEPFLWDAVLAGIVAAAFAIVLGNRLVRRENTWAPITIDETILVSVALTISTTLLGGPLLAGAVLMPLLFGVIVHHTRLAPGWKPSYLYVVPVLAPIGGLAAGFAGYGTLLSELLAFVVLPLAGALGLPLRATIRKRFGR